MKIRDMHSTLSKDSEEYEMPSKGVDIIADDGRTLFTVCLRDGGKIEVYASGFCKHDETMFDDQIAISPRASNMVVIQRKQYK